MLENNSKIIMNLDDEIKCLSEIVEMLKHQNKLKKITVKKKELLLQKIMLEQYKLI